MHLERRYLQENQSPIENLSEVKLLALAATAVLTVQSTVGEIKIKNKEIYVSFTLIRRWPMTPELSSRPL